MGKFTHLHLHTQYSILDGAAKISKLMEKASKDGMTAMAITDHGNMYGVMEFLTLAKKNKIKPIIGCEMYVAANGMHEKKSKEDRSGYHLILLAKNKTGYHNLAKLVSKAYKEGFYYTPRIDKELLKQHTEGLIASTACLGGEVPKTIMRKGKEAARELIEEFKEMFGDDFYLELQRHGIDDQNKVNEVLLELSKETHVPLIATNDVHYVNKDDFEAHHILICLNTGKDVDDKDGMHYTGNEFFKTTNEMLDLFADIPEAIENTQKIVDKIEDFDLNRPILLPHYPIPDEFNDQDSYLAHLTFEGAKKKYEEINEEIKDRLELELGIIKDMGFAGYFLIVQDFINKAREMNVIVGPGRGSAAGSAVAFCVGITNVDPIKYNLLFERFLNPERVSMPDIDVDFDDYGRDDVIQYVVDKYGEEKVAQIVTFGTMAAKSSIRDVARVLKLPLPEADRLAKMVPERPGTTLAMAYSEVKELENEKKQGEELIKKTLTFAETLEGSARNTGTHACGVIIGPDDLMEHIPLATAKDSKLMVTQFDGKYVESVGMLKMDFLGLKTLTIIKDALEIIKKNKGIDLNIDDIPLDDEPTFRLYQEGKTFGTFQFESDGMRNYLKQLKPTSIEDLIAMNALYRPGPMDFIPIFIDRKHGREKVEYPHEMLEGILKNTYGIMVYQEQIMQAAQIIGGFTLGKADILRRAMGKKKMDVMQQMMGEFVEGAAKHDITKEKAEYIFGIMENFAKYGFNRSHSAAYSIVAYQTAYLKANHPAAYMAAVLGHNMADIKKVNLFINDCNKMGIEVLGPDINESDYKFTVSKSGVIRFGLGAIKGVGEAAVEALIKEREENGPYQDIFDLTSRVNLRAVNKKSLESLAKVGAFDSFTNFHRAQYLHIEPNDNLTGIDKTVRFGNKVKELKNSAQQSLFGDSDFDNIVSPELPDCKPWSNMELLKLEKELIGFYVSGHPLDDFKYDLKYLCNTTPEELKKDLRPWLNKNFKIGGMVVEFSEKFSKRGDAFGIFTIEDYNDNFKFFVFKEKYLRFKHLLEVGTKVLINGTVRPRYRDSKDLSVEINEMTLLSEAREKFFKKVSISFDIDYLNEKLTNTLDQLITSNIGETPLFIELLSKNDKGQQLKLLLSSAQYKIEPSNKLFDLLHDFEEFNIGVN